MQELSYGYIDPDLAMPFERAHVSDAGIDIAAPKDIPVYRSTLTLIPTNIRVAIPHGAFGLLTLRSGIAIKRHWSIQQGVGIIDSGYRGEIIVPVYNKGLDYKLKAGTRFAQLLILPLFPCEPKLSSLDETERGIGGFGSTGEGCERG